MKEIMEQYGTGLLQIFGGMGALLLLRELVQPQGVIYVLLMQYMNGICG